jgi:hypothetical protein
MTMTRRVRPLGAPWRLVRRRDGQAEAAESVYSIAHAISEGVGVPLFEDLSADATVELKAVC